MDDLTAIAFAREALEQTYAVVPEWLTKYSGVSMRIDRARDLFEVDFC